MKYKQREIVLLPFPFSDLSAVKRRPVLILSNNFFNDTHNDIIVAAITSKLFIDEYSVVLDDNDLEYGFLPEHSIVKVSKLFTANKKNIIKKFSIVNRDKFSEVITLVNNLLSNSESHSH